MRILALDPGTNRTGVSIIDYDDNDGTPLVIMVETIKADRLSLQIQYVIDVHGSRFARILSTGDRLRILLEMYQPDAVASESPYLGRFPQSFAALTEILTEFRRRLFEWEPSKTLHVIDPSTVKVFMGVKGTSPDKDLMTKALAKKALLYSEYINPNDLDEHSIDSLCVNLCFANRLLSINIGT